MEKNHNILQTLVDNIKQLPGIGPKAAQRIAFIFLLVTRN